MLKGRGIEIKYVQDAIVERLDAEGEVKSRQLSNYGEVHGPGGQSCEEGRLGSLSLKLLLQIMCHFHSAVSAVASRTISDARHYADRKYLNGPAHSNTAPVR